MFNRDFSRKERWVKYVSQRVVFSFDERSYDSLKEVQERGAFPSMGAAVREAISLSEVLQAQADEGFTEVVVKNPKTHQEKTLVIPSLKRAGRTK